VPQCDREASIMRRPWSTRGCCATEKKMYNGVQKTLEEEEMNGTEKEL
jgi:hypothetical protein